MRSHRRTAIVAGFAVGVALIALGAPPDMAGATTPGAISGLVSDAADAPVAGVQVKVLDAATDEVVVQVESAADGTYTAPDLPPGDYLVCFYADQASGGASTTGYLDECWNGVPIWDGIDLGEVTAVTVTSGATVTGINPTLTAGGAVSGQITDSTNHPLAGVTVYADAGPISPPLRMGSATTGVDGKYVINRLPAASQYYVCFSPTNATGGTSTTGYLLQCFDHAPGQAFGGVVPWTGATYFPIAPGVTATDKNAVVDAAGEISGTVTNAAGGPVAGIRVTADGPATATDVTDDQGHYLLSVDNDGGGANGLAVGTRLPIGAYTLRFNAFDVPAYASVYYPTTVTPTAGSPTVVDEQIPLAAKISGVVTDVAGNPVEDVEVSLLVNGYPTTYAYTPANGTYAFPRLAPGSYAVCFNADVATGGTSSAGYFDQCYDGASDVDPTVVTLSAGENRTDVGAQLASASKIAGTITNSAGNPIWGVRASIVGPRNLSYGDAYTDFDGRYVSPRLPAGNYQVCFFYASSAQPSYAPECYDDVTVGDAPTPVHTTVGKVTTVDAVLATAPQHDTTPPTVELRKPTSRFQLSKTITVDYTGSDAGSGVYSYDVRFRAAPWNGQFGGYTSRPGWQYTTADKVRLSGHPGMTYCFSVRARDTAGNESEYTPDRCVTVPLDDRALHASAGWTRSRPDNAYLGTLTSSGIHGATLSLGGAHFRRLALVVTTCPRCGKVAIAVDGSHFRTVDTHSAATHERVILVQPAAARRTARIMLRVVSNGHPVRIDGLAISTV